MDYVVFKNDMYCEGTLHFKTGVKYEILGEVEGKLAVSYMDKKNQTHCSLIPKDFDGIEIGEE